MQVFMMRERRNISMMGRVIVSENKSVLRIHILQPVLIDHGIPASCDNVNGKFKGGHVYKYRFPLRYASFFAGLKCFWTVEDKTIGEDEMAFSISLMKAEII